MKTLAREDCRRELLARLERLRPESPRRWGRMTTHQMVCHVADACRMALGQNTVSDSTGVAQRSIVKWLALYAPLRWRTGIPTRPEIDQEAAGTRPESFATDVAKVASLLSAIASREHTAAWPNHPIFGPLTRREWLRWAYLHTDHHLRQFGA
ncbi:MAG: DinB family protein [Vicinamibacterales bacterium]